MFCKEKPGQSSIAMFNYQRMRNPARFCLALLQIAQDWERLCQERGRCSQPPTLLEPPRVEHQEPQLPKIKKKLDLEVDFAMSNGFKWLSSLCSQEFPGAHPDPWRGRCLLGFTVGALGCTEDVLVHGQAGWENCATTS